MFNIVLVHPQIPQNTGAIGRMCVNANLKLHIVKPAVFDLSEKAVRRAGLDYWKILKPQIWQSLDEFLEANLSHKERFFFATTKTNRLTTTLNLSQGILYFLAERARDCQESLWI